MRHSQDLHVLNVTAGQQLEATTDRRLLGGLRWALPVAAAVLIADQATKRWALDRLTPGSCQQPDACIDLVAGARFHLVFNKGAAFAQGTGFGPVLGALAILITAVLLYLAWRRVDTRGSLLLGAIAGGAIGNLVDRATRAEDGMLSGAVVDFVDLGWWPVFNVADAAIVCGVLGFVVVSWFDEQAEVKAAAQAQPAMGDLAEEASVTDDAEPADGRLDVSTPGLDVDENPSG